MRRSCSHGVTVPNVLLRAVLKKFPVEKVPVVLFSPDANLRVQAAFRDKCLKRLFDITGVTGDKPLLCGQHQVGGFNHRGTEITFYFVPDPPQQPAQLEVALNARASGHDQLFDFEAFTAFGVAGSAT